MTVTTLEIFIRLSAAIIVAGAIGYNREQMNHPAGIRTHILVCLGSCVLAMTQQEIAAQALFLAAHQKAAFQVLRIDNSRLIAQIVSGIGFLGAGTIVITRHAVVGLTTAASLWATAGLGIAIGMGYYRVAIISSVAILLVLSLLKRVIKVQSFKKIEIKYTKRTETMSYIEQYFNEHSIKITGVRFQADTIDHEDIYTSVYAIEPPKQLSYSDVIRSLSRHPTIKKIRLINI